MGWGRGGWVGTGSEYQLLPSRIYSLVKSALVLANINLEVVCSDCLFLLFIPTEWDSYMDADCEYLRNYVATASYLVVQGSAQLCSQHA